MANYLASVGMEVHAELATASKMFSRAPVAFGGEPNTRVDPVTLGLPGALPVINRQAVEMVLRTALALNCKIAMRSIFHRKNYFYPDLPKGYQISQYGEENPLGYQGWLDIPLQNGATKRVTIRRVHLEEDTGKLLHLPSGGSGVDYNRAGVPLMEVVTGMNPETGRPDIETGDEAAAYLKALRQILVYLGVCDGKMEEGSLRAEPNISIRPEGSPDLGTKTELKNLGSFRSVEMGIAFEVRRQAAELDNGGKVLQETRGWSEERGVSFAMRLKEGESDYRYFPDPDLPPMTFTPEYIDLLREGLAELPLAKERRFRETLGLSAYDAALLVADRDWAAWFEEAVALGGDPKAVTNWMMGDFARLLNERATPLRESKITPAHLVELTGLVADATINGKTAKEIFAQSYRTGERPKALVAASGATQITDEGAIRDIVAGILAANPDVVAKYRSGQASVKGFLIGQAMKATTGRANPSVVQRLLSGALESNGDAEKSLIDDLDQWGRASGWKGEDLIKIRNFSKGILEKEVGDLEQAGFPNPGVFLIYIAELGFLHLKQVPNASLAGISGFKVVLDPHRGALRITCGNLASLKETNFSLQLDKIEVLFREDLLLFRTWFLDLINRFVIGNHKWLRIRTIEAEMVITLDVVSYSDVEVPVEFTI